MPKRPPDWERYEIILVLAIGHRRKWPASLSESDPEVIELSRLLRRIRNISTVEQPKVRNPAGVVRKYGDLYSLLPWNQVRPTNGGGLTSEIVSEYVLAPDSYF